MFDFKKIDKRVGIGDYLVFKSSQAVTIGLGSCVGVFIYDSSTKIGGLAHIMLPYSKNPKNEPNPKKYADTCLSLMLEDMKNMGVNYKNLVAKIIGGANIFFNDRASSLDIGTKNVEAVRNILKENKISIIAEDVGGYLGKTVYVDSITGRVIIKRVDMKVYEL